MPGDTAIEEMLPLRIEKNSPVPVYLQIAESVRTLIRSGTLVPGMRLPPERVMCEGIAVSKMTLRQAYGLLERDGLIQSQRGVGTVISEPRVHKLLREMRSFTEEMAARGKRASSRLLGLRLAAPSFPAREFFALEERQQVWKLERLRLADDAPVALETVELPAHMFPNLDSMDLQNQSLYSVLEQRYGVKLATCNEQISAAEPDRTQKELLAIDRRVALLVIQRKSHAANGAPIEVSVTAYRGDLYVASIDAVRAPKVF